ncbi:uncharacterized protein PV09_02493 [Verruconis gallopava]|uniref:Zn(2)-C6 fungal-type domain-containing protein n=1 Tax=Verruconis gallopava TaxID=253628 RepID=A0A0D2AIS9_9PEZI|nr:uncharacterized protein PV09_02493 [Verruconis gallopava]KIW06813.1 hypothetical protein PV09_02493 [Verruconis gallopava]
MSNRYQQQHRANKPLLPATDPRDPEYGDEGSSSAGGAAGRQPKRSKVTAVACQPCQKRKSKCDGLRPICSSCQQKGRTDCVYDSSSDLRRTSALKQRIENLQQEVSDLKDILLALCTAYSSGAGDSLLALVHQNIGGGDFSRVPELAQLLRASESLNSTSRLHMAHGSFGQTNTSFDRFQQEPQGFDVEYHGIVQGNVQQSSAIDGQHDWDAHKASQQVESNPQDYRPGYMYHP